MTDTQDENQQVQFSELQLLANMYTPDELRFQVDFCLLQITFFYI